MKTINNDILRGGSAIATFLYGGPEHRGKIYYAVENNELPAFRIGTQVCARKSTLLAWIAEQEKQFASGASGTH